MTKLIISLSVWATIWICDIEHETDFTLFTFRLFIIQKIGSEITEQNDFLKI